MTKTIPSTYPGVTTIDTRGQSPVRANDFQTMAEALHFIWATRTSEWNGHTFDPAWQTDSTNYTPISSSASRDLNELHITGVADRKVDTGSDIVRVGYRAFGKDVDMQMAITNEETATQLDTISASQGSAWGYFSATSDLAYADVTDGSGNPQLLSASLLAKTTEVTANLWIVRVGEIEITAASELPDGL